MAPDRRRAGKESRADETHLARHTRYSKTPRTQRRSTRPTPCESKFNRVTTSLTSRLQELTSPETEVSPEQVHNLVSCLLQEDLLLSLAKNIHRLPFEARKDTQVIFSNAFRYKPPGNTASEPLALHYVISYKPEIIVSLCYGYERRESAMPCGGVLREALNYDAIAALILYDEPTPDGRPRELASIDPAEPSSGKGVFWKFFDWIDKGAFEVSADAFNTFRVSDMCFWVTPKQTITSVVRKSSRGTNNWLLLTYRRTLISSSPSTTASSSNRTAMSRSGSR